MTPEKTNNTLLWVIGIILIGLGLLYAAFANITQDENEPLKIGVIAPLSGDAAVYGAVIKQAYDLAVTEINNNGGVNGRSLELVYEDGKCERETAVLAVQKLLETKVKFILGGVCSGETLAAAPLTQEARVFLLSPSSTSPDISEAGDLVFRTYPSDTLEAKMMAEFATATAQNRAAIISENTEFGQGARNAFKGVYTGSVVFDETFNPGDTDFAGMITRMKVQNPQMLYLIPQSPASGERILQQIESAGMNIALFASNSMLDHSAFAKNPSLYEELVVAEVFLPQEGKTQEFLSAYEARYGAAPAYRAFAASAYDDVYLLVEALKISGEDPEAVAGYFNALKGWTGALGSVGFDERGDVEGVGISLMRVVGGNLVNFVSGNGSN